MTNNNTGLTLSATKTPTISELIGYPSNTLSDETMKDFAGTAKSLLHKLYGNDTIKDLPSLVNTLIESECDCIAELLIYGIHLSVFVPTNNGTRIIDIDGLSIFDLRNYYDVSMEIFDDMKSKYYNTERIIVYKYLGKDCDTVKSVNECFNGLDLVELSTVF